MQYLGLMKDTKIHLLKATVPLLIVVISVICMRLTSVSEVPNIQNQPLSMLFLYAFNLFTLGGINLGFPDISNSAGIILLSMYFIAPLISISALIEALFSYFNVLNRLKILAGNHYVIFGAGKISGEIPGIISDLEIHKLKPPTIVVIDKSDNVTLEKHPKCIFIKSNASIELIDEVNIYKAKCIFLNMNDDWSNFLILKEILDKNILSSNHLKKIFVRIENNSILHNLVQLNLNEKVVYYNTQIISVDSFFEKAYNKEKLIRNLSERKYNLFFIGFGRYSQKFLQKMLENDLLIDKIFLVSSNVKNELMGFNIETKERFIKFFEIEKSIEYSYENFGSNTINDYYCNEKIKTIWFIMTEQETINLNFAGILLNQMRTIGIQDEIYVRSNFIDFSDVEFLDNNINFISSYRYTNSFFRKELEKDFI